MHDPLPFGAWLRQYRGARDLTRQDLARLIGCSVETIRKIENGERRPSKQAAQLLAERLDIAPEERAVLAQYARMSLSPSHAPGHTSGGASAIEPPNNLRRPLTSLIGRDDEIPAA